MSKSRKLVKLRYYRAASDVDDALPFLEAQLEDSDSTEITGRNRSALANLIIEYCSSDPELQESVGISNEELESIANDPIPRQLVEKFVAHLKLVRARTAVCICG